MPLTTGWELIREPHTWDKYVYDEDFGDFTYRLQIVVEECRKSVRFWTMLSSGKKRRHLNVFEEKSEKTHSGLKALRQMKDVAMDFPRYYNQVKRPTGKSQYIVIGWSDSKRRNIYTRLQKEGFLFMNLDGNKVLVKKV